MDLETLEKQINSFVDEYELYLSADRAIKIKPSIDKYIQQLDSIMETMADTKKQQKSKLFLLKAKLLDMLPEYEKSAEDYLNKSIKFNPMDGDCWNTLGHVLWKKKDLPAAKKAFEMALQYCGPNKKSLRYQSVLLRSMGATNEERKENVNQSVIMAKNALTLDLKDGQSWYFVGNAYMSNFFVNMKKITQLENAIKAYNEAEKYLKYPNPDLYTNRGTVKKYVEEYEDAKQNFLKSMEIDPSDFAKKEAQAISDKVGAIKLKLEQFESSKNKKFTNLLKSIPLVSQNKSMRKFSELKEGLNKGLLLPVISLCSVSQKGDIPISFIIVDSDGALGVLSVFNTDVTAYDQFRENCDVLIADPVLKTIKFEGFTYECIQVFELNKILVDKASMENKFTPNVLVSETFQK